MRAVSCKATQLEVVERPTPVPDKGQVLIDVLRCGICGSDLHARHHCDDMAEVARGAGYDDFMRSDQEVILGHEFCDEIPRARRCSRAWLWGRPAPLPLEHREDPATGSSGRRRTAHEKDVATPPCP